MNDERRQCANPDCNVWFVPKRPWQEFHHKNCRAAMHNRRRREHHVPASALALIDAAMAWYKGDGNFEQEEALKAACRRHEREGG